MSAVTDRDMAVERKALHVPELEEICKVLQTGLSNNFENVAVSVVDCPDLTKEPFTLAAAGICGSPRLVDVGGVPYLIPTPQHDKKYNLDRIARQIDLPGAFIVGAGAGMFHGTICEFIPNVITASDCTQGNDLSWGAVISPENGVLYLKGCSSKEVLHLGNLFASEGKPGRVIEVKASKRKGPTNFVTNMRTTLKDHFGDKPVGIGGSFLIEKGKATLHVMPCYSSTPLNSDEDVKKWLNFREMSAPLICNTVFISSDPGLDLRVEHTHCFSHHGEGGHYHYDTTPDEISYRGYFVPAEWMYRIDRPLQTHLIGRD